MNDVTRDFQSALESSCQPKHNPRLPTVTKPGKVVCYSQKMAFCCGNLGTSFVTRPPTSMVKETAINQRENQGNKNFGNMRDNIKGHLVIKKE